MSRRIRLVFSLVSISLVFAPIRALPAHAQAGAGSAELGLICEAPADVLECNALAAALERELGLPVRRSAEAIEPSLRVSASSKRAVDVHLLRLTQPSVGRTLDVSAPNTPVVETLALVAANLLRDEAAEWLALQQPAAATPEPAAPPPPAPAPPAAAPITQPPAPPPAAAPPPTAAKVFRNVCGKSPLRRVPVGVDFVPFLGMSLRDKLDVERNVSLNILGGVTGAVRGVELAGLFSIDRDRLCGAQFAGVFNYVGGPVLGAQFSLINFARGPLSGVQAGLINLDGGGLRGAQLGLVSFANGDVLGLQAALVNVGVGDYQGPQFGLANLITRRAHGGQFGLVNVTGSDLRGAQFGLVNVDGYDATGLQAGLINVTAHRQRGLMLGLINVAPQGDVSIGLVNVHARGETHLDLWATDAGMFMLGASHGTGISHNIYGIGWKPMADTPAFSAAFGFGFRALRAAPVGVDVDLLAYGLMARDPNHDRFNFAGIYQLRVPITLAIVRGVAVFIAPSVSVSLTDTDSHLQELALYKTTRLTSAQGAAWVVRIWPGASLGLRFF